MNLTLYFRLIVTVIFQKRGNSKNYNNDYFFCPTVFAKDGFNVSLQINNGNYCESNKGYRRLGHTWNEVEYGFPSKNEPLMWQYCEMFEEEKEGNVIGTVGRIPVEVLEAIFELHGGIDWEKTISIEAFEKFTE